jgi:hypothetical protein
VWPPCEQRADAAYRLVYLVVRHGEWRQQPRRVGPGGVQHQALLEQRPPHERRRFVGAEGEHQSKSAHLEAEVA